MQSEYNNLVIFDLDGVLIDSTRLHFDALNEALRLHGEAPISWADNLSIYDGLPTKKKLEILSGRTNLDPMKHAAIARSKHKISLADIQNYANPFVEAIFAEVKSRGFKIAIASNNIREVVWAFIYEMNLMKYLSFMVSTDDVRRPKPYPEMYWACMGACNAIPATTFIVEDSHIGRQGAHDSGAKLIAVKDSYEVTLERIMSELNGGPRHKAIPWIDPNLNILVPMAGAGSRFAQAGYTFPKPLIEVFQKPMIEVVLRGLNIQDAQYTFVVQKEHRAKYDLDNMLGRLVKNPNIIEVDGVTEGAACTTLLAKPFIDNDRPLLIVNSDQYVEWNSNEVMYNFASPHIDGGIVTFKSAHPKWSYAAVNFHDGFVSEVAEKRVISDNATAGFYYWRKGSDYVDAAESMIAKNIRVNGEFYVAPAYNEAILIGQKIITKNIDRMWGLGTPEDLDYFLEHFTGEI